jgi:SAM-dependent methyltransferase
MNLRLVTDEALERSDVVANCRMNRERGIAGRNSYTADLRMNPVDFLQERLATADRVAWLDLCCGTGRALIQAAQCLRELRLENRVTIHGVDLVAMFDPVPESISCIRWDAAPLGGWIASIEYDLITCVHGLHYVGDKLDLIARAASWLSSDGLFIAHLDLDNLKMTTGPWSAGQLGKRFRQVGLSYDPRHHLLRCEGKRCIAFPFTYAGADDTAGPNFTGQPAVDSYYAPQGVLRASP